MVRVADRCNHLDADAVLTTGQMDPDASGVPEMCAALDAAVAAARMGGGAACERFVHVAALGWLPRSH